MWRIILMVVLALSWMEVFTQTPPTQQTPSSSPPPAQAQDNKPARPTSTTLEFTEEGERWYWYETAQGEALAPPTKTSDKSVKLDIPERAETLWVLDAQTGNLAKLAVKDLTEKTELGSERWSHVARVQVNVRAQNDNPVASALVTLTDANKTVHRALIEPTSEGIVILERVALGKGELEVRYNTDQRLTQTVDLKRERSQLVPNLSVQVTGEVATVAPPGDKSESQQATPASRIGALVLYVISGALGIAVLLLLVRLARQKEQPLAEAMQKLGVPIPDSTAPTPASSSPSSAPSPQPDLPPIETAGVDPTASAPITPSAPATRLVGTTGTYSGQVFELQADLLTIGREATNAIALESDLAVSRRHAQIVKQGEQVEIEDLGSTNGTYVNGIRISAPTPLRVGDTVQIGSTVFRVE